MTGAYARERYEQACLLLPPPLRLQALDAAKEMGETAEELRLRRGEPLMLTTPEGEKILTGPAVTGEDLEQVVDQVTDWSRYTAAETIRQGYLTAKGGFRVGLCGTAVVEQGQITRCHAVRTEVYVHDMTDDEIRGYIATGEPADKAGGYGIQGAFAKYIDRIDGDYYNVVGLPVSYVYQTLKEMGAL